MEYFYGMREKISFFFFTENCTIENIKFNIFLDWEFPSLFQYNNIIISV